MKLLRFEFLDVDGNGNNVCLLVAVDNVMWEDTSITKNQIDDAIAAYIEEVEDWQYEELVHDVLNSFGLDYEIISPVTFYI